MSVQPVVLIDAATSSVTSPTFDLLDVYENVMAVAVVTGSGSFSGSRVTLSGSLDSDSWYPLATANFSSASTFTLSTGEPAALLARYIQVSVLVDNGSPTITVTLAAKLWR